MDFGLMRFLDRFAYRNPKQRTKQHGHSRTTAVDDRVPVKALTGKHLDSVAPEDRFFLRSLKAVASKKEDASSSDDDDDDVRADAMDFAADDLDLEDDSDSDDSPIVGLPIYDSDGSEGGASDSDGSDDEAASDASSGDSGDSGSAGSEPDDFPFSDDDEDDAAPPQQEKKTAAAPPQQTEKKKRKGASPFADADAYFAAHPDQLDEDEAGGSEEEEAEGVNHLGHTHSHGRRGFVVALARAWAERRRGRLSILCTVPRTQLSFGSICELSRRSSRGDSCTAQSSSSSRYAL